MVWGVNVPTKPLGIAIVNSPENALGVGVESMSGFR
jgi:hypothetical protein